MLSAAEGCREPSGKCQGIVKELKFVELLFLRSGSFTLYFHEFMELNLNEVNSFIDSLHVTSNFLTLTS